MNTTLRARRLSLVAIAILVPSLQAATAAADTPQQATPALVAHRLVWRYVQPLPVLSERLCDAAGNCVRPFSFSGGEPSVGDVAGTAVQAGAGTMLPDGSIYANSTIKFTGTFRGCGTGSVAMRSTRLNQDGVTSGEIVIVDNSGTGDLVGMRGTGRIVDGRADPTGGDQGTGFVQMVVHCKRP
jgi:hypothetical protein